MSQKTKTNYQGCKETVTVTDEHPNSSYGIPVVLVDGVVIGDTDIYTFRSHGYRDSLQSGADIRTAMAHGIPSSWMMKGIK